MVQYCHPYCRSTKKKILVIVQCCLVKPALNMVKVLKANESILAPDRQLIDRQQNLILLNLLLLQPTYMYFLIA